MSTLLIPPLPDDLALCCLARVPRIHHSSLRAVSSAWKKVLDSPSFVSLRNNLGLTDASLFLLPLFPEHPHSLNCVELDLSSQRRRSVVFKNTAIGSSIFLEGHACISFGRCVMILGGLGNDSLHTPSPRLSIFDTLTHQWTFGGSMGVARGEFAWGVIDGKLYVAGGYGGDDVGNRVEAEAYDFETDTWSRISSMPFSVTRDFFFVLKGRLFVRGWIQASRSVIFLSYRPITDEWREEPWMLNLFKDIRPLSFCKVATTSLDETLFIVEVKESRTYTECETEPLYLKIRKLDSRTLKWKAVCSIFDEVTHYDCECPASFDREVKFHGLKDKVLILDHSEEAEDIDVDETDQVVKASLLCPSVWATAIINA
eukprot:c21533_g1_i1 orf=409-1521(-)